MDKFIHPLSDVLAGNIGENTKVWQFTVILKGAIIGSNCNINCNCFVENDVLIGNNVTVKSGVQLWDGITIEDNVFIGPNVTFSNDMVPRSKIYPVKFNSTVIRKGASIGANATIIGGVDIGAFSFIGAGSIVTKNIPAYTVWYGNPAKHKGYITEDACLLDLNLVDKKSGEQYFLKNNKPFKV